jgi:hypothetical protein
MYFSKFSIRHRILILGETGIQVQLYVYLRGWGWVSMHHISLQK